MLMGSQPAATTSSQPAATSSSQPPQLAASSSHPPQLAASSSQPARTTSSQPSGSQPSQPPRRSPRKKLTPRKKLKNWICGLWILNNKVPSHLCDVPSKNLYILNKKVPSHLWPIMNLCVCYPKCWGTNVPLRHHATLNARQYYVFWHVFLWMKMQLLPQAILSIFFMIFALTCCPNSAISTYTMQKSHNKQGKVMPKFTNNFKPLRWFTSIHAATIHSLFWNGCTLTFFIWFTCSHLLHKHHTQSNKHNH